LTTITGTYGNSLAAKQYVQKNDAAGASTTRYLLPTYASTTSPASVNCDILGVSDKSRRIVGSATTSFTDNTNFNNPATLDGGDYYAVPANKN
jgi:hypothetical protein